MKFKLKYLLLLFAFAAGFSVYAQEENVDKEGSDKITVKPSIFSIRTDFSVPTPTNAAWRKCMVGIGEGTASFDLRIAGNVFLGVGYKASLLYTPPKFFVFDLKTKMQMHDAFLTVGYDIYKSNTFFITPRINAGYCFTKYTHVQPKSAVPAGYKPEYSSQFVEAQCTFTWMVEKQAGISFHTSFVMVNHVWDPKFVFMQDWIQLGGVNQQALTTYINFGFGVYLGMGKGKTKAVK